MADLVFFLTQSVKFIMYFSLLVKSSHFFSPISTELLFLINFIIRSFYYFTSFRCLRSSQDFVRIFDFGFDRLKARERDASRTLSIYDAICYLFDSWYVRFDDGIQDVGGDFASQLNFYRWDNGNERVGFFNLLPWLCRILKNLLFILSLILKYFSLSFSSYYINSLNFSSSLVTRFNSGLKVLSNKFNRYLIREGVQIFVAFRKSTYNIFSFSFLFQARDESIATFYTLPKRNLIILANYQNIIQLTFLQYFELILHIIQFYQISNLFCGSILGKFKQQLYLQIIYFMFKQIQSNYSYLCIITISIISQTILFLFCYEKLLKNIFFFLQLQFNHFYSQNTSLAKLILIFQERDLIQKLQHNQVHKQRRLLLTKNEKLKYFPHILTSQVLILLNSVYFAYLNKTHNDLIFHRNHEQYASYFSNPQCPASGQHFHKLGIEQSQELFLAFAFCQLLLFNLQIYSQKYLLTIFAVYPTDILQSQTRAIQDFFVRYWRRVRLGQFNLWFSIMALEDTQTFDQKQYNPQDKRDKITTNNLLIKIKIWEASYSQQIVQVFYEMGLGLPLYHFVVGFYVREPKLELDPLGLLHLWGVIVSSWQKTNLGDFALLQFNQIQQKFKLSTFITTIRYIQQRSFPKLKVIKKKHAQFSLFVQILSIHQYLPIYNIFTPEQKHKLNQKIQKSSIFQTSGSNK